MIKLCDSPSLWLAIYLMDWAPVAEEEAEVYCASERIVTDLKNFLGGIPNYGRTTHSGE